MDFACAPLFIDSTSVFAIFFVAQLHVIVFWTYFAYFLQPPDFVFFFQFIVMHIYITLLAGSGIRLCSVFRTL